MKDAVNEHDRIADMSSASDSLYAYNTVTKKTKLAMLFPLTKTRMARAASTTKLTASLCIPAHTREAKTACAHSCGVNIFGTKLIFVLRLQPAPPALVLVATAFEIMHARTHSQEAQKSVKCFTNMRRFF